MKKRINTWCFLYAFFSVTLSFAQTLTPGSYQLNFGNVYENAPDSLPLVLRNTLGKTVTVTGIRFYTIYGSPAFSTTSSWFTVSDGDSITLWIKFSPIHNIFHNTEMVIENDGLRGYVSIDLRGQGKYSNHYYDPTENLAEENLKSAIHTLTGAGYISLLYNPARDEMFMSVDNKKINGQGASQNTLECVYTGREAVGYVDRTDCQNNFSFNTEHTFPQSLFTSMEPMKSDLHHLFPTDNAANNERGDNPFGLVTSPTWSNSGSLSDGTTFEPRDEQKGRAARAMFYFVLRYQNYNNFLSGQESILRSWHHLFPPDNIDRRRNNDIFSLQQNRNPFVDYPVLLDRITSVSTLSIAPVLQSIDITEDTIVYGTVAAGTPAVFDFVMVNNGNTDIQLTSFNLSQPAELSFLNSGNDTVIAPGESLTLSIRCLTATSDSIRAFLTFNTNVSGSNSVSIPIYVNDPVFSGIRNPYEGLSIAPNPTHDYIRISFAGSNENFSCNIFDLLGKNVLIKKNISKDEIIDLSVMTPGVYFLQINGRSGVVVRKLIKE